MEKEILVNGIKISEDMIFKRNIKDSHEKIKDSRVCILGLGGLGSNIAVFLARSGIGKMCLVDFDIVDASNINRQHYYLKHIGMKKTQAIEDVIGSINPFVDLIIKDVYVDNENIIDIVKDYDYIVEAFDNAESKALVINEILSNFDDKIIVSASGMAGIEDSNNIKTTRKFKNLYVCGDEYSDFEEYSGMMAPRVNICAGHQANLILRLLLDKEK